MPKRPSEALARKWYGLLSVCLLIDTMFTPEYPRIWTPRPPSMRLNLTRSQPAGQPAQLGGAHGSRRTRRRVVVEWGGYLSCSLSQGANHSRQAPASGSSPSPPPAGCRDTRRLALAQLPADTKALDQLLLLLLLLVESCSSSSGSNSTLRFAAGPSIGGVSLQFA